MYGMGSTDKTGSDSGWTLSELVFVVLIIGILLVIVIPVLVSVSDHAAKKTCFGNQRQLEGVVAVWSNEEGHDDPSVIAGVLTGTNQLVVDEYLPHVPRCPSAPVPLDRLNPTAAEGAYTIGTSGTVDPCPWGDLGAHGVYPH